MAATPVNDMAEEPAPHRISTIAPYRWHIINNIAIKLRWDWDQVSNTVDRFTRDGVVLTVSWTPTELGQVTATDGVAITHSDRAKLQKLCRALGAEIRDDQKFVSMPAGNITKLPDLSVLKAAALTGLKVVDDPTPGVPATPASSKADSADALSPFAETNADSSTWDQIGWQIPLGRDSTRAEIEALCGGDHRYRGIVRLPADVVCYSGHEKAGKSGYAFDGWDTKRELFYYTGEGGINNQEFKGGNSAISDHNVKDTVLRLFVAVGNVGSSDTRVHRYVGQFTVDKEAPYVLRRAPGRDQVPRNVIVFRLRPVGHVITDVAQISIIEGVVAASVIEAVSVEAVPVAVTASERTQFERTISGEVEQKEAGLTARFREYLEKSHSREVKRYKITTPSGLLWTDTADITNGVLYEAKGTAERMSVRLALGQVLDYGRYVEGADLAVLLPETPAADLVELLESHKVGCVVEGKVGEFSDMTGLKRCP